MHAGANTANAKMVCFGVSGLAERHTEEYRDFSIFKPIHTTKKSVSPLRGKKKSNIEIRNLKMPHSPEGKVILNQIDSEQNPSFLFSSLKVDFCSFHSFNGFNLYPFF